MIRIWGAYLYEQGMGRMNMYDQGMGINPYIENIYNKNTFEALG